MKRLLRILLPTAIGAISLLATVLPASASSSSAGLYAGSGCYGTAFVQGSGGTPRFQTTGCVGAATYLTGSWVYGGNVYRANFGWGPGDQYVYTQAGSSPIFSNHDLFYSQTNGLVGLSAY